MPSLSTLARGLAGAILGRPDLPNPETSQDKFHFFRYVRPYDPKNPYSKPTEPDIISDMNHGPHGGVTFYFEWRPVSRTARFGFSLCHENDPFIKAEGRNQAKEAFDAGDIYTITNVLDKMSLCDNVRIGLHRHFHPSRGPDITKFLGGEFAILDVSSSNFESTKEMMDRLTGLNAWLRLVRRQEEHFQPYMKLDSDDLEELARQPH